MIRITDDNHHGARIRARYRNRRFETITHQNDLMLLGSEEAIAGRDKVMSWPIERLMAFHTWAHDVQLVNPFAYVEEFEAAFPAETTPIEGAPQ